MDSNFNKSKFQDDFTFLKITYILNAIIGQAVHHFKRLGWQIQMPKTTLQNIDPVQSGACLNYTLKSNDVLFWKKKAFISDNLKFVT